MAAARRSYAQYCGLARALDVVGERWTLLVVRELLAGPRRYSDIQASLPGIGTSLLAERLKHLEQEGIVARSYLPPPAASSVYELTADGHALGEALSPLITWGARRLGKRSRRESFRIEWIVRYLEAVSQPEQSRGVHESYEFRLAEGTFHVQADDGVVRIAVGPSRTPPDLVLETQVETLVAIGIGGAAGAAEVAAGRLAVSGSPEAASRALRILCPPAPGAQAGSSAR